MATVSDVVASRPIVGLAGVIAGFLAGVTLTHPTNRANDVELDVHGLRIERPRPGATPPEIHAEVYASAKWTRSDGGIGSRDLGPSKCTFTSADNPVAISRLVALTNAAATRCDAGQGSDWPHVVEVMGTTVEGDAGYALHVYTTRPNGGDPIDLGKAPDCPTWVGDLPAALETAVYKIAVRCAEDRLEELP